MHQLAADLFDELLALEQSLLEPKGRIDIGHLEAMLAADFLEFGSSGRMWNRATTISRLAQEESSSVSRRQLSDFKVRRLAENIALATYTLTRQTAGGPSVRTLRSSIWKHAGGRWQMSFHQGTPAAAVE